jgi:hypothetical protein
VGAAVVLTVVHPVPRGDVPRLREIAEWLRDAGEESAAALIGCCRMDIKYLTTVTPSMGSAPSAIYDVALAAPHRILRCPERLLESDIIERAIRECFTTERLDVRQVYWKPILESDEDPPIVSTVDFPALDMPATRELWQKALDRRPSDPEGAITAARALLETVLKNLLHDLEVVYDDSADVPALYRTASRELRLAPDQHTERVFRQILGGCVAVVGGLSAVRNRLGDAHGRGHGRMKPQARHADLAVKLSGTLTEFLLATWAHRDPRGPSPDR